MPRKNLTVADLVPGVKFTELWGDGGTIERKYRVCALVDDQIVVKRHVGGRWRYSICDALYYKMACENGRIVSR